MPLLSCQPTDLIIGPCNPGLVRSGAEDRWGVKACVPAEVEETASEDTGTEDLSEPDPPDVPSAYEYSGVEETRPYDQAAFEDAVNSALLEVRQLTGGPAIDSYLIMFDLADGACPEEVTLDGTTTWTGSCTTSDGVAFNGYGAHEHFVDADRMGGGSLTTGTTVSGTGTIVAVDGTILEIAGYAWDLVGTSMDGGTTTWMTGMKGSFQWTDDRAEETWFGGPMRPNLDMVATQMEHPLSGLVQSMHIDGGIAGLPVSWGTVYFDDVSAYSATSGFWECPEEALGTVSVRDSGGYWFEVVFDVEEDDGLYTIPEGACDGCGIVYRDGERVGEACTDFSVLVDWGESPW